jgi:hypothetical protein
LYPLPQKDVQFLDDNRSTLRDILVAEAQAQGRQLTNAELANEVDDHLAKEKARVWGRWLTRASVVLLGIASALLLLRQFHRRWQWGVMVMLVASLGVWIWPYSTTGNSITDSFGRFASAVFASQSSRLAFEFVLFNVLLPIVQIVGLFLLLVMMVKPEESKPNP